MSPPEDLCGDSSSSGPIPSRRSGAWRRPGGYTPFKTHLLHLTATDCNWLWRDLLQSPTREQRWIRQLLFGRGRPHLTDDGCDRQEPLYDSGYEGSHHWDQPAGGYD